MKIHSPSSNYDIDDDENQFSKTETDLFEDILADSMINLYSAKEAFEIELQKLKDVGNEEHELTKIETRLNDLNDLSDLNPDVCLKNLKIEIEETTKQKTEAEKLKDVETRLNDLNPDVRLKNLKIEIEEMMKQKIEAEVQYIAISKGVECLKVQRGLMVEQKKVVAEQMEMMKKLEDAEVKAIELRIQAEKLQVTCEEILEKEEVWEVRNMVWRLSSVFCVQLILFVLVVFLICF